MKLRKQNILANIRKSYRNQLLFPCICYIIVIALTYVTSISNILLPKEISNTTQLIAAYDNGNICVNTTYKELHYTGYKSSQFNTTTGYFYYTVYDDTCLFLLLSPKVSNHGTSYIERLNVSGRLIQGSNLYSQMLYTLSKDLLWTPEGMNQAALPIYISQPAHHFSLLLLCFTYGILGIIMLVYFTRSILYISCPILSPPIRNLRRFGDIQELMPMLEKEMRNSTLFCNHNIFITKQFFIAFLSSGSFILPVSQIKQVYEHSVLHRFLWYHSKISYTLHIKGNKRQHFQCNQLDKKDTSEILKILFKLNGNITVGLN